MDHYNKKRIYLSSPHMSDEGYELDYIKQAFDTNWIAPLGPNVDAFEHEFAQKIGAKHAVALSSGTAAIHMALKAIGVGEGDIVFCSSLTFSATANPIIYQNAIPVFIDSDFETWNMCPKALEQALEKYSKRNKPPKAIIVVHIYGLSADMDSIMEICNRYHVPVIEDAAEALGTTYKGKQVGTIGEYGIFSFNGNKIITTSGGGILVANHPDEQKAEERIAKVRFWSTQARDPAKHYQHSELGFNYRMSNVLAGIGRGQLKVLDLRVQRKREIFEFFKNVLCIIEGVQFMPMNDWNHPNCWLSCVLFEDKNKPKAIMDSLENENIESRPIWKPMHLQPYFEKYVFFGTHVSDKIFENGLCLPSDTRLSISDLKIITCAINNELQ
jgi:dTDP-4-amino-4,6-dideoxygalactose transaminase